MGARADAAVLILMAFAGTLRGQAPAKSGIELGFEERVRNENWNNIVDANSTLDDETEQIRYRTRFWAKVPVTSNIEVFAGLASETNQKLGKQNKFDEVMFESAYIDIKKLFVKGLSLRVGRQNLMRGEGFIMLEGDAWDGSRTIYMNAADLSYSFKKSTVELIGILDPSRDRFLPRFNDQHRLLTEWDEQALGFYYTDKNLKNTSIEAYSFYKKEIKDTRAVTSAQYQPDRHVTTTGGRVVQKFSKNWTGVGEFAVQRGAQHASSLMQAKTIGGWGGYGYLKRTWDKTWKPYVQTGYWALSGDDPRTSNRVEDWDPLFSRWPKWSELYIYSQLKERGVSYWTNLSMWQGEFGFSPRKKIDCRFTYYEMGALHSFPGDPRTYGTGTHRGENLQGRVDYAINKNWKAHVLYETQLPGGFYSKADPGYFLRFELSYLMRWPLHEGPLFAHNTTTH